MKRLAVVLLLLVAAVGLIAASMPTDQRGSITVSSSAVGFASTACRLGGSATGIEYPAVVQVQSNGIYYLLNSSATPVSTDFIGYPGDYIPVPKPSQFRAIRSGSADALLAYQCFSQY